MIAYCGLDCEKCEAFIATQRNDDALRKEVAAKWAAQYNAPILPEHINCTGCLSPGIKTFYCDQMCEIRKCAFQKSLRHCGACPEFPCEKLGFIFDRVPEARANIESLK